LFVPLYWGPQNICGEQGEGKGVKCDSFCIHMWISPG